MQPLAFNWLIVYPLQTLKCLGWRIDLFAEAFSFVYTFFDHIFIFITFILTQPQYNWMQTYIDNIFITNLTHWFLQLLHNSDFIHVIDMFRYEQKQQNSFDPKSGIFFNCKKLFEYFFYNSDELFIKIVNIHLSETWLITIVGML